MTDLILGFMLYSATRMRLALTLMGALHELSQGVMQTRQIFAVNNPSPSAP
jgi:hypothetical protein